MHFSTLTHQTAFLGLARRHRGGGDPKATLTARLASCSGCDVTEEFPQLLASGGVCARRVDGAARGRSENPQPLRRQPRACWALS